MIVSQAATRLQNRGWVQIGEIQKSPKFRIYLWSHPEHPETADGIPQKKASEYLDKRKRKQIHNET